MSPKNLVELCCIPCFFKPTPTTRRFLNLLPRSSCGETTPHLQTECSQIICCQAILHGSRKRGGWGGAAPSPLQTQCSHDGFHKDSYVVKQAGRAQPHPHLQAQCSHDRLQERINSVKASLHGSQKRELATARQLHPAARLNKVHETER